MTDLSGFNIPTDVSLKYSSQSGEFLLINCDEDLRRCFTSCSYPKIPRICGSTHKSPSTLLNMKDKSEENILSATVHESDGDEDVETSADNAISRQNNSFLEADNGLRLSDVFNEIPKSLNSKTDDDGNRMVIIESVGSTESENDNDEPDQSITFIAMASPTQVQTFHLETISNLDTPCSSWFENKLLIDPDVLTEVREDNLNILPEMSHSVCKSWDNDELNDWGIRYFAD